MCLMLLKPPLVLRPSGGCTEQEAIEIAVIKLLLRSYYDIVRNNIKDLVPKSIMHFLVTYSFLQPLPINRLVRVIKLKVHHLLSSRNNLGIYIFLTWRNNFRYLSQFDKACEHISYKLLQFCTFL